MRRLHQSRAPRSGPRQNCRQLRIVDPSSEPTHPAPGETTSVAVTVLMGTPVPVAVAPPSIPVAVMVELSTHELSPFALPVMFVHRDARPIGPFPHVASYPCRTTREPAAMSTSHTISRDDTSPTGNCRTCELVTPMMRSGWIWLSGSDQEMVSGLQDWHQRPATLMRKQERSTWWLVMNSLALRQHLQTYRSSSHSPAVEAW